MTPALETIFGNRTATWTCLNLQSYGDGYARRVADTFDISVNLVQAQLTHFEGGGLPVSEAAGRTRVFSWSPSSATAANLRPFLEAELTQPPKDFTERYFRNRQRPRRPGKPL